MKRLLPFLILTLPACTANDRYMLTQPWPWTSNGAGGATLSIDETEVFGPAPPQLTPTQNPDGSISLSPSPKKPARASKTKRRA